MATKTFWIQLEQHYWDTMPNNIDRMTNQTATGFQYVPLISPVTGANRFVKMYRPLSDADGNKVSALIFRRYTENWATPADRKINAWDLNEPDPTDSGTMGTIPGAVIECNVGDDVEIHFKNNDTRETEVPDVKSRAHSMHTHGFVYKAEHDGAFPLSPGDTEQQIAIVSPDEADLWEAVGVTDGLKRGDRVPPGGTFTYKWTTAGWPSTAGVWLYHDHSCCDVENVNLGAIGIVVIHNLNDKNNDFARLDDEDNILDDAIGDFPNGKFNGSPAKLAFTPIKGFSAIDIKGLPIEFAQIRRDKNAVEILPKNSGVTGKDIERVALIRESGLIFQSSPDLQSIIGVLQRKYITPPTNALYLQLYHSLGNDDEPEKYMCINGRSYLGNTPSLVAGTTTKMRFGVVGMGHYSMHTFHIHGHRWIIPGPDGTTPVDIQNSAQIRAVSQFEDTRIFGPANSFVFTIDNTAPLNEDGTLNADGGFMRAGGPKPSDNKGEWHMHCHVLDHMMMGMMGSLLIVEENDTVSLPVGYECG